MRTIAPIILASVLLLCTACTGAPPELVEETTEAKPEGTGAERTQYVERTVHAPHAEPEPSPVQTPETGSEHPPGTPAEEESTSSITKLTDIPEDWRTPSQKAGTNEGGQDVSNTPLLSPAERAEKGPCLSAYYQSLPPEQRGPESQRVTAEANARGVSPFDVVGC
jgi:rubredoxin